MSMVTTSGASSIVGVSGASATCGRMSGWSQQFDRRAQAC
jgi:hypothetical protein